MNVTAPSDLLKVYNPHKVTLVSRINKTVPVISKKKKVWKAVNFTYKNKSKVSVILRDEINNLQTIFAEYL